MALTAEVFDGVDVAHLRRTRRRSPRTGRRSPRPAARSSWTTPAASGSTPTCRSSCPRSTRTGAPSGRAASSPTPNCTTPAMIVALGALHAEFGLRELVVSSYQAACGAGRTGVDPLPPQLDVVAGHRELGTRPGDVRRVIGDETGPVPGAGRAQRGAVGRLAAGGRLDLGGDEGARGDPQDPRTCPTCPSPPPACGCPSSPRTRSPSTPVSRARSAERPPRDPRGRPAVVVLDDPDEPASSPRPPTSSAPTRAGSAGCAGRPDDPHALDLFVCGDNLRKGAALNMAQIAELVAAELGGG